MSELANLRLNKDDKAGILQKAMEFGFAKRTKDLATREDALAVACYDTIYSKTLRDQLAAIPKGWLTIVGKGARRDWCRRLIVQIGGQVVSLQLTDIALHVKSDAEQTCIGIIDGRRLVDRYRDLTAAQEVLKSERKVAQAQIQALLDRSVTLRTLAGMWPEGKAFYSHLKPRAGVPMIQISVINTALGLKAAA
jgi:hypothetical protein